MTGAYNTMGDINERIKLLRQYRCYSEQFMASILKINVMTYKRYEDTYKFKAFELRDVADVLEISMDYLLGRVDIPTPVITNENFKEILEIIRPGRSTFF